jgi:fibronectin type 3 domain-containing protein
MKFFRPVLLSMAAMAMLFGACVIPNGNEWKGSEGAEGLAVPANFSATAMSSDSVYLVWDEVSGIEIYALFSSDRKNGDYELLDKVENLSFTDDSLNPATTHYYKVAALSADGTGPLSDSAQTRTLDAGAVPLLRPPAGIIAEVLSPSSVRISWDAVTGAKYNLYRAGSSGGAKTKLNASPLSNTTLS